MNQRSSISKWPLKSGGQSQTARRIPQNDSRPHATSPPSSSSTAIRFCLALRLLRDEGLLDFKRGRGVHVTGSPDRGALVAKARELLELGREYGYRRDDLIRFIENLP